MFINISTDRIYIQIKQDTNHFDRDSIERTLGNKLIQIAKEYKFSRIIVLNGPGGFTNLRVGILCLNMLNRLFNQRFDFYSIDKISLYNYCVKNNILPSQGVIYIGQRKNIWDYNFRIGKYQQIKKDTLSSGDTCFFDQIFDSQYFERDITKNMVTITGDQNINICYHGHTTTLSLDKLTLKSEKYLSANYFIQPIIGKQGQ